MNGQDKIDVELFKIVAKSISASQSLEMMAGHFCQLLIAALGIKGCALFVLNPATSELEHLSNFGLSNAYLAKGPVLADKGMGETARGGSIIVRDVETDSRIQYPEEAKKEGIRAVVSIPIVLSGETLGDLRLYDQHVWDVTPRDVDSLHTLAEMLGLALRYMRLRNALQAVREVISDVFF